MDILINSVGTYHNVQCYFTGQLNLAKAANNKKRNDQTYFDFVNFILSKDCAVKDIKFLMSE